MKHFFILILLLNLGCNSKGGAFKNLDPIETGDESTESPIEIESFTPAADPVVLVSASNSTFAVSVKSGAGNVKYKFVLDDVTTLYEGASPFLTIAGTSLTAGTHSLKITATNSVSSATKSFNLRKNQAPSTLSSTPSLTGNTINCDDGTLTMQALTTDLDGDSFTQTWLLDGATVTGTTAGTTITNTATSARLDYSPSCAVAGFHTLTLRLSDGYETSDFTWSVAVANPAVETIISYYPTSNNITYLSTDVQNTFNVTGSGVGALTFTWKLDGATVQTSSGATFSSYNLLGSSMATGNHTLTVQVTDSSVTNDPATPAIRSWAIYKNEKPRIFAVTPSAAKSINLQSALSLTASIEDAVDTFTTTITKGALDCIPTSECGLSSVSLPTATGSFAGSFTSGTVFLGENNFLLSVTDSHGETSTQSFTVTANYFSDSCNSLNAGEICTLVGLPGLGSGTNVATDANKVRVTPTRMTRDQRGNFFFSDHTSNTVWYYNTTASPVTILNVTVPSNTIYVVAGTGIAGAGGNGQFARKVALNFGNWGGGLAWDSGREELFIADYSNGRVLKVDSSGRAYVVCGGSTLQGQGDIAKNSRCQGPVDVEFDTANRRLYVSQYNNHVIKVIDASALDFNTWPSYIVAGAYGSASNTTGTANLTSFASWSTQSGTTRLNGPWGLYLDTADQILYFTEYTSCRVRAIGLPGAVSRTVGGQVITAGNVASITRPSLGGGNACGAHTLNASTSVANNLFARPMELVVQKSGGNVLGIYVADQGANRVAFINSSGAPVTIGNQLIGNNEANNIFGNGTTNAPTNPPSGKTSAAFDPFGLELVGSTLYMGIRGNNIIRTLAVNVADGSIGNFLGGTGRAGYSGNAALNSALVTLNNPLSMFFKGSGGTISDPIPGNSLFISDKNNYLIRSINLNNGRVEDFIGTGASGNENLTNTVATSTRIRSGEAMGVYNGFFLYTDSNPNCYIRAYNPFSSDENFFSTLINLNKTSPIAGTYNSCGDFSGTAARNTTDPLASLNQPYGVAGDPANGKIYVASYNSHCIQQVSDNGTIRPFIGTCGTQASSPVYGGSYNDPSLLLRNPAEIVMDPMSGNEGNFFFTDWSSQGTAHVKYVNLVNSSPVDFFGGAISVSQNNVETVLAGTASPGYITTIAAFEDWLCYGSGTGTGGNNTVYCRNRTTGDAKTFGIPGIGGVQLETEHEGASVTSGSSTVTFATPSGLAFDSDGNLYVSEQVSHVIRKIKRWW